MPAFMLNKQPSFALLIPYIHLSLRLLLGLALVSLGLGTFARVTSQTLSNPFLTYMDIFPGQSLSAAVAQGFTCRYTQYYYTTPAQNQCVLTLTSGAFSSIEVVGSGDNIREIKFSLHENTFQLGDLLVLFELPHFQSYPQTTFAFWRDYFVELTTSGRAQVNPVSQAVWSVTFTRFVSSPSV